VKIFILLILILFSIAVLAQNQNITDANGLKQGKWILTGALLNKKEYAADAKVEEGVYLNDKKDGVWITYYPNGKVKNKITYINNSPKGYYITYFENGFPEEEGTWELNKNIGNFIRYYSNGNVRQEFNFDNSGKRVGEQKYYWENGNIMIEGTWVNGQESGKLIEYHSDGSIKYLKNFDNGKLDTLNIETFKQGEKLADPKVNKPELKFSGVFNGEGKFTKMNLDRKPIEQGIYKNYKLIEGKRFIYNNKGELMRTAIIKNGQYAGDE
jgi:antitoxin component YwqK of YwqJK toxin-antitoxin module